MFKIGDPVVHPTRGAGVITAFVKRAEEGKDYYQIEMLGEIALKLLLPVEKAVAIGVRPAIRAEELPQIWEILMAAPAELPKKSRKRYHLLKEKLAAAGTEQLAEVIRDVNSLRQADGSLKTRDRNIYLESLNLLAGEVAAIKGLDLLAARALVKEKLLG